MPARPQANWESGLREKSLPGLTYDRFDREKETAKFVMQWVNAEASEANQSSYRYAAHG